MIGGEIVSKKRTEFLEEERVEIQTELKKEQKPHVYRRLMALKLKAIDGKRSEEIAQLMGLKQTSVNRIIQRYKGKGMAVIVGARHKGGHRYMTIEEEEEFLAGFRRRGEAGQVIEVSEIQKTYEEKVGHAVTRSAIYYLLKKHGWRKKMPRGQHPKKASEEEIEAYKKNHGRDAGTEEQQAETARNVSGRGWIWTNQ